MNVWQIAPRLHQGSVPERGSLDVDVVVLCAQEYQFPANRYGARPFGPDVRIIRCPLTDGNMPLAPKLIPYALQAAVEVARLWAHGSRVLVTCAMGRNRSGLVTALALMELGHSVDAAIGAVRKARPNAIDNPHFEYLLRGIGSRRRAVA